MIKFNLQLFTNETITTDIEPGISVDFASKLTNNIRTLQRILAIDELDALPEGNAIPIYAYNQKNTPAQVAEGVTIPLTEVERTLVKTITMTLKKYRKQSTAELIQKVGRTRAINETDNVILSNVQKDIKTDFFTMLATGSGTATGVGVQKALADAWGKVVKGFDDIDATPVFFVSSDDVADYLGGASISMQTAFGWNYIENFLGLGDTFVTPALTKGTAYATAKENLRGAYVPANNGAVADSFGLNGDGTGLIGITHSVETSNASIETLMMSGVVFYPEIVSKVYEVTITSAGA